MVFKKEENGIYSLCVPFEAIYTTVFALNEGDKWILCDTATTDFDAENYILPALLDLGVTPDYIVVSHSHRDHVGGLALLRSVFPEAAIITNPMVLLDRFEVFSLKGHAEDALAVFDPRTKTLLSFDCLQQRGVDKYRRGISNKAMYLKSIEIVRNMDVERILFSHNYDPCGYSVKGQEAIENVLNICEEYCNLQKNSVQNTKR